MTSISETLKQGDYVKVDGARAYLDLQAIATYYAATAEAALVLLLKGEEDAARGLHTAAQTIMELVDEVVKVAQEIDPAYTAQRHAEGRKAAVDALRAE